MLARRLQQRVGSPDVGLEEGRGVGDGVVVVALCREVHARIGALEEPARQRSVADVPHNEFHAVGGKPRKVFGIARVGELVEDGHMNAGPVLDHPMYEVGTDEPGPSGDYDVFQGALHSE